MSGLEHKSFLWYHLGVTNKKNNHPDVNSIGTPAAVFIQYYNKNIPDAFPRATFETLEKFRVLYPSLFKKNNEWTIDKHRKKFMDWLTSYRKES